MKNALITSPFGIMVWLLCAMILIAGCRFSAGSNAAPRHLTMKMVWAGHQGGGPSPTPSVHWIDGPEALESTVRPGSPLRLSIERGGMDWSRYGLVWIRMGQKRTGGFGLRLAASEAVIQKGVAVVSVHWRQPPQGAFVTQMLTSPTMVLKLPRGDYREIVVKDASGGVRAHTKPGQR